MSTADSAAFLANEFRRQSFERPNLSYVRFPLRGIDFTPAMRSHLFCTISQSHRGPGNRIMHTDGEWDVGGEPFHHMIFVTGNVIAGDPESWRVFCRMSESALRSLGQGSSVGDWLTHLVSMAGERRVNSPLLQRALIWFRDGRGNIQGDGLPADEGARTRRASRAIDSRLEFEQLDDLWEASAQAIDSLAWRAWPVYSPAQLRSDFGVSHGTIVGQLKSGGIRNHKVTSKQYHIHPDDVARALATKAAREKNRARSRS